MQLENQEIELQSLKSQVKSQQVQITSTNAFNSIIEELKQSFAEAQASLSEQAMLFDEKSI